MAEKCNGIVGSVNNDGKSAETKRNYVDIPPGEEVIISGLSCKLPDSANAYHLRDNLYNKVDMISSDNRRWEHVHPEIPPRAGKLLQLDTFDTGLFGIPERQIDTMDPMCRLLMETTYEAILDAGMHPSDFEGTRTGVFLGVCASETEKVVCYDQFRVPGGHAIVGCERSMYANRISYWLKVDGSSTVTDTACSSSMYAFEMAYQALREGSCEYAIVGSSSICIHPYVSLQFARLGILSPDGACKTFDEAANGYARSEGIAVCILQKAKTAKRLYAEVIHAKINCDGYKPQGIMFPSGEMQKTLLKDFYKECGLPPTCLSYMEAHGTGTAVGDLEELKTIDEVFCTGRDRPLLIGTIKSNIGHNEPVSGISSIIKVIIGFENGLIPPNLHYKNPRKEIDALVKNRMIVVTENTPWPDKKAYVGFNSFGFGGANCHTLFKSHEKLKINGGEPSDDLPRLVCFSGRTHLCAESIMKDLESRKLDAEYVALYHNIYRKPLEGCYHKAYVLLSKTTGVLSKYTKFNDEKRDLHLHFGNVDRNLWECFANLLELPVFQQVFNRFQKTFDHEEINFDVNILLKKRNPDPDVLQQILTTVMVQIGLWESLRLLRVHVDEVFGTKIGVLAEAYAKNFLDLEQVATLAYFVGLLFKDNDESANDIVKLSSMNLREFATQMLVAKKHRKLTESEHKQLEYINRSIIIETDSQEISVPSNVTVIECGTRKNSLLKHAHTFKFLVTTDSSQAVEGLFVFLGSLYVEGYEMKLDEMYPKVQFPVSCGTPMISPLIKFKTKKYKVVGYKEVDALAKGYLTFGINIREKEYAYVSGHVIDGRTLFPATGYLNLVWTIFSQMKTRMLTDTNVLFENVRFRRAVNIPKDATVKISVFIFKTSGKFEVQEGETAVVTGQISAIDDDTHDDLEDFPIERKRNDSVVKLKEKDIYKELKLRGYNYSGVFKSLKECDLNANRGLIEWQDNWVGFLDNMLQMFILQEDTRSLFVPTGIQRLAIYTKRHLDYVNALGETPRIPVYAYKNAGTLRSKYVEIRGLNASAISRRKVRTDPVLESYKFVPNVASLTLEESVRVNVQIALENAPGIRVKTVEIIDDDSKENAAMISPTIMDVLADIPLIQPEVVIFSKKVLDVENVAVENSELKKDSKILILVATGFSKRPQLLAKGTEAIKEDGFLLSREEIGTELSFAGMTVVTVHTLLLTGELLVLLRKAAVSKETAAIKICEDVSKWLPLVQQRSALKTDSQIVLYSAEPKSGILGFANCLRREQNGERVRCFFSYDAAPEFGVKCPFYEEQLSKGLAINVFKGGQWGTYRHMLLKETIERKVNPEHAFVDVAMPGDFASLKWTEGRLRNDMQIDGVLVKICYSALNFRDIMTASGRLPADVITKNRAEQMNVQGIEYSGIDTKGKRVMGIIAVGGLSTLVVTDPLHMYSVPAEWSLEDAATVPVVYSTCLFALVEKGKLKSTDSILIHSGAGGVGQAAINIALHFGCDIFVTVGTQEKRDFLRKNFPQIPDSHIGNSRDTSFENLICKETNGRGVDVVLNSLAEEKLKASLRCLAEGGRFLEIGKFDLVLNSDLELQMLLQGKTFYGIMLDLLFKLDLSVRKYVNVMFNDYLAKGVIVPLVRTVFVPQDVEKAFRYMTTGKHIGKVLIKIRDEENSSLEDFPRSLPRIYCNPKYSSVIVGGLGGFGLELADWLIVRGAKKIVLVSRQGISNGYQASRVRRWRQYDVEVIISRKDVTTKEGCAELLREAAALGAVENIFNLAVVLKDKTLENQTVRDFELSFAPKAVAAQHLDTLSRYMCPELRHFVVFSSVVCGRGNGGQTNYGMANSAMERICEQRKQDGHPALAIEWGAVGDVGLVAEMAETSAEIAIGGTLQQKISNCLKVLDVLMNQEEEAVVSSIVVAEKRKSFGEQNIIDAIAAILGIRDIKTVSPHATLPELGLDSMMGVEIKQTLENEHDIFLTAQDIRTMTFTRLKEIMQEREQGKMVHDVETTNNGLQLMFQSIEDENLSKSPVLSMSTRCASIIHSSRAVLLFPGIEGMSLTVKPLASQLSCCALCFQYCYESPEDSIQDMARTILPHVLQNTKQETPFLIVAHSFGSLVAVEVVRLLEQLGHVGKLILLDGSPYMMRFVAQQQLQSDSEVELQMKLLFSLMGHFFPTNLFTQYKEELEKCNSYEERLQVLMKRSPNDGPHAKHYQKKLALSFYKRIKCVLSYQQSAFGKLKSKVALYKPEVATIAGMDADFKLAEICEQVVEVKSFTGDHKSILANPELAKEIDKEMATEFCSFKGAERQAN